MLIFIFQAALHNLRYSKGGGARGILFNYEKRYRKLTLLLLGLRPFQKNFFASGGH